jgi:hypothetical protein
MLENGLVSIGAGKDLAGPWESAVLLPEPPLFAGAAAAAGGGAANDRP